MDPRISFLLILIGFPLLEFYLLLLAADAVGANITVFIVIFSAVLGGLLMRHQGTYNLSRVRKSMQRGEMPAVAMFESVFVFFAAVLLLIPGFITDAIGLLLLISPLRRLIVLKAMGLKGFKPPPGPGPGPGGQGPSDPSSDGPRTIEGDYKRED